MQASYLAPVAAPKSDFPNRFFMLLLASGLTSHLAAAQATAPSPAAAANADMLSWMAHGLLAAVLGLTILTCLVLLIAFTTSRRVDARPLAPAQAPAVLRPSVAAALAESLAPAPPARAAA